METLDDLVLHHIVDLLTIKDITNLCLVSKVYYRLLHNKYTISLSFPLDNNYMIKDEPEKPVLAILTNGTTDNDCLFNTKKQIAKINIGSLKLLRLWSPNKEDENDMKSSVVYNQKILFNLYHRHWKQGTSFNLRNLKINIYEMEHVYRLKQVLSVMPALTELDLHIPIKTAAHFNLIKDVVAHPSMQKVSITILPKPEIIGYFIILQSNNLEELSLAGAGKLRISMEGLTKLRRLRFLPQSQEEIGKLLTGAGANLKPECHQECRKNYHECHKLDLSDTVQRFKLMYEQCPNLQYYNDVKIGDICRDNFLEWTKKVADFISQDNG